MLGAVAGPLVATLLVWATLDFRAIILWTIVPGLVATSAMFFLTTEGPAAVVQAQSRAATSALRRFPRSFWIFLVGVFLFGLGDFSRTFLIWLAARGLGEDGHQAAGAVSVAVLLYTLHNVVSAAAAYPVGRAGDRRSKLWLLIAGYGIGVGTNVMLAVGSSSLAWLVTAIVLSGIYIATEETLEKAVVAEALPRELRSLGLGVLACANAVGDMVSSLYVGLMLEGGRPGLAFGLASALGTLGLLWLLISARAGSLRSEDGAR
jgi:MFS family permease